VANYKFRNGGIDNGLAGGHSEFKIALNRI